MQQSIGPYRIEGEIGRGGMGVVYRAVDVRLNRVVAIKALPEELATDPARLDRFEREARALAHVSHPNIAGIHGVEEQNGKRYLVLEFVEGQTLADRIDRGPVELEEAIDIACQIAAGVGAAHDAGVIHRDLKPANIRLTPDGAVKVLDFGLARHDEERSSSGASREATLTTPAHLTHTTPGMILGTAAYMSPEQARGRRADKRSDIWSFGVVLYEMLTGASPFGGESVADSLGAVLHKDPDLGRVPPSVRRALARCLERDRDRRYRDIGDVSLELRSALEEPAVAAEKGSPARRVGIVAVIVALVASAAGLAAGWLAKPSTPSRPLRLSITAPPAHTMGNPMLSPDGALVTFGARPADNPAQPMVGYSRKLDELEAVPVPGTRGARAPAFSPSGAWVSFMAPVAEGSSELRLLKVAIGRGLPPVPIATMPDSVAVSGYNHLWLTEDTLVFSDARTHQLRFVDANNGTVSDPVTIDLGDYTGSFDQLLSRVDDTRVLCGLYRYTSAGFQQDIGLVDTSAARATVLLENSSKARPGPDGSLLFSRVSTLYGAMVDLERIEVGTPVQLVDGLRTPGPYQDAPFQVARDGTLLFLPGGEQGARRRIELRLPDGSATPLDLEPRPFDEGLAASPDETRLAVVVISPDKLFEIWGTEIDAPRMRRLRGVPTSDLNYPQFAGDNDTFVYMRNEGSKAGIEAASFDGLFEPYWVVEPVDGFVGPTSVDTRRNRVLVVWEQPQGFSLHRADLKRGSSLVPLFKDSANRSDGDYSPDGSMLAYTSDETGRDEVYVSTVRDDGSLGRPVAVTTAGARGLRWASSSGASTSQTLVVYTREGEFSYVITPGERPHVGRAEPMGYDRHNMVGNADQLSGGRMLVIVRDDSEALPTHAEVIVNWYDTASRMIRGEQ